MAIDEELLKVPDTGDSLKQSCTTVSFGYFPVEQVSSDDCDETVGPHRQAFDDDEDLCISFPSENEKCNASCISRGPHASPGQNDMVIADGSDKAITKKSILVTNEKRVNVSPPSPAYNHHHRIHGEHCNSVDTGSVCYYKRKKQRKRNRVVNYGSHCWHLVKKRIVFCLSVSLSFSEAKGSPGLFVSNPVNVAVVSGREVPYQLTLGLNETGNIHWTAGTNVLFNSGENVSAENDTIYAYSSNGTWFIGYKQTQYDDADYQCFGYSNDVESVCSYLEVISEPNVTTNISSTDTVVETDKYTHIAVTVSFNCSGRLNASLNTTCTVEHVPCVHLSVGHFQCISICHLLSGNIQFNYSICFSAETDHDQSDNVYNTNDFCHPFSFFSLKEGRSQTKHTSGYILLIIVIVVVVGLVIVLCIVIYVCKAKIKCCLQKCRKCSKSSGQLPVQELTPMVMVTR